MLRRLMSIFPRGREKQLIRAAEDGRLDLVDELLQAGGNLGRQSGSPASDILQGTRAESCH